MSPTDLDDRIREVVSHVAATAPEPTPFADILSHRLFPVRSAERTRGRGLAAAGIALATVICLVPVVIWVRSDSRHRPSASDALPVTHEVVDYTQRTEVTCPTGAPDVTGQFDRMTFETWGEETNGKFRMRVTYPDGTTRDVLDFGSPYYPTRVFTRGDIKGRQLGCRDSVGTLQYEPGQGSMWSLRAMVPIPHTADGQTKVPQYDDLGTRIAGPHTDSRGRTANLWRQTTTGTESAGSGPVYGLVQVTEWFVDPETGLVLEQSWHQHIDGIGDSWSVRTLARRESIPGNDRLFSEVGYDEQVMSNAPQSPPTSVVSTTTLPSTPSPPGT